MTILVAYDGSADSRAAIEFAAKHLAAEPTLIVTVWEPLLVQLKKYPLAATGAIDPDTEQEAQTQAEQHAKEGAELAIAAGLSDVTYRAVADNESIWKTIVDVADEVDASLVVTGSRGLAGVRSVLLGSVSNHVLHHAHRPTLIVPPAKA
ncbi:nucleotide-binding universal stress UspA family protein [Nonomuraea fuscirosea]|uniref:Nucleotide-binding universal stress UspA family protein n=1 Tax=Nonomuraea fuscirosea TaxID=1291556 RepID=A0A2T0MWZ1_9ACTN|nr:universal stress protein [Nonomuraea fuscirosea]PRX63594.1 nucleotide-binding universal stress UspA family protein [Nonomuraea fuscirosea]